MTAPLAWAVALGCALGLGLWAIVGRLPRLARPRLAARVAPYLVDVSAEARAFVFRASADPLPVLGVLGAPALRLFQAVFGGVLGVVSRTELLLRQAGDPRPVEAYRVQQMLWTLTGAALGVAIAVPLGAGRGATAYLAAPLVGAGAGLLLRERLLIRAARRGVRRLEGELPTVLEFLALSLAAGEAVHDAIRRVARVGSGQLAKELERVSAEVGVGVPLATALARSGDELRVPALTRFLAQVVGALDRGSPLADLLRAQAADARDEARRALLETAGKKEIAMLVPLVFLILPVTIVLAVFPGFLALQTQL